MNLEQLIKQRDEFLEKNPHMKEYQEEIDRLLENSPDRLKTMSFLLEQNMLKLSEQLKGLQDILGNIK